MTASAANPIYTVYAVSGGAKYNLSSSLMSIDMIEQKQQISQSVKIELMNSKVGGSWLSDIIGDQSRVFVYANDGTRNDEVFRGYAWTGGLSSALSDNTFSLKCYDNLIFFQESDESAYFGPGKSTKSVFSSLCSKWGVKLDYTYGSITHEKLPLRGNLADIFTSDLLDLVKDRIGKDYVIISTKDVMQVKYIGSNDTVYSIVGGSNAIKAKTEWSKDGMITKVVILGREDYEDRTPVEATVSGATAKYGTLQKLLDRKENTTLEDAQKEAQNIIDTSGKPKVEYEVQCSDIPWIRKGDKVFVNAGGIKGKYMYAISVERSISNKSKEMTLTCIDV